MIRAGQMREVVRIERRSTVQDAAGEPVNTWTLVAERRAEIVRMPGREVWASAARNARIPTVWRMRYLDGVVPEMRLVSGARVYDIVSAIDPDGLGSELTVLSEEHVEEPR